MLETPWAANLIGRVSTDLLLEMLEDENVRVSGESLATRLKSTLSGLKHMHNSIKMIHDPLYHQMIDLKDKIDNFTTTDDEGIVLLQQFQQKWISTTRRSIRKIDSTLKSLEESLTLQQMESLHSCISKPHQPM